jgi:hypothetical protein
MGFSKGIHSEKPPLTGNCINPFTKVNMQQKEPFFPNRTVPWRRTAIADLSRGDAFGVIRAFVFVA